MDTVTIVRTLEKESRLPHSIELMRSRELAGVPLAEGELSGYYNEFLEALDVAVERVTEIWGVPDFTGSYGDSGCPDWSDAISIATWSRDDRVVFLAFDHPDHDSALTLTAGVRQRDAPGPTSERGVESTPAF